MVLVSNYVAESTTHDSSVHFSLPPSMPHLNPGKLREDLFKKFASGDGIAGRKPYGFRTRMIHCIGWKRLEANSMFHFEDVNKHNFNAIMRRCLVWRVKARFEDPHVIEAAYKDIHRDGVFRKDPDLANFLTSPPAVAAGLQLQHAFEAEHSKQDCLDMIENYVVWGGDGGLTESVMREACKLPPRDLTNVATRAAAIINVEEMDTEQEEVEKWEALGTSLVEFLLIRKKLFATQALVRTMNCKGGPNVSKDAWIDTLLAKQFLMQCPGSGKATQLFMIILTAKTELQSIIRHNDRECTVTLPETYDLASFATYLHGSMNRRENVQILADTLKAMSQAKRGRAGRPTPDEKKQKAELQERAQKMLNAEKDSDATLETLQRGRARKAAKHRPAQDVKSEEEATVEEVCFHPVICSYHYAGPDTIRSRKQVKDFAAQRMSRRVQAMVLGHTHDLDIENSLFTLICQLLQKLDLTPGMPQDAWDALLQCRTERSRICREVLSVCPTRGKKLLVAILYGGTVPAHLQNLDFVHDLQKASLYCRWAAASTMPAVYTKLLEEKEKPHPEASVLSYLYTACEDFILSHWADFLQTTFGPNHLSLHYDGVRISAVPGMSIEDVCSRSEAHILEKTGFSVRIREKKCFLVLEWVKQIGKKECPMFSADHILCKRGNCIPHALAAAGIFNGEDVGLLEESSSPHNVHMQQRGCRTYKQCMQMFECSLYPQLPSQDDQIPDVPFLLHLENGGTPHCVAVRKVPEKPNQVAVVDVDGTFELSMTDFQESFMNGIDASTAVFFLLEENKAEEADQSLDKLLELSAAGDAEDELLEVLSDATSDPDVVEDLCLEEEKDSSRQTGLEWLDPDGKLCVDELLLQSLAEEIRKLSLAKDHQTKQMQALRCPACPFRMFKRKDQLRTHMQRHHTRKQQFCCSGTKQLRIVLALHDADQLLGKTKETNYLQRSAELLRASEKPNLSPSRNAIDRNIRLLLDSHGPRFVHADYLKAGVSARRVGRLWYTRAFGEQVWQELLLHHGKARWG